MTRWARQTELAVAVLAMSWALAGCQQFLGLEDGTPREPTGAGGEGGAGASGNASSATTTSGGDCFCADDTPEFWEERVYVVVTKGSDPIPGFCPGGAPYLDQRSAGPPAPTCLPCECIPQATGLACTQAIKCYPSGDCTQGAVDRTGAYGDGLCHAVDGVDASCQATSAPTVVGNGSCQASGGDVNPGPWIQVLTECAAGAATGSCGPGQSCLEPPPPGATLCIRRSGDIGCPPEWPTHYLAFHVGEDGRACTSCSCGALAGASCSGAYRLSSLGSFCGLPLLTLSVGGCAPTASVEISFDRTGIGLQGASCPPTGGSPTEVNPANGVTYCCK